MAETIQPAVLKIGIDGVAKPVTKVISDVGTLEQKSNELIEAIKAVDPDNTTERERLERTLRHVQSRMTHFKDHLDIQFPHFTSTPIR